MRFDWFVADNAEVPHSGIMDVEADEVILTFEGDDGTKAENLAGILNADFDPTRDDLKRLMDELGLV